MYIGSDKGKYFLKINKNTGKIVETFVTDDFLKNDISSDDKYFYFPTVDYGGKDKSGNDKYGVALMRLSKTTLKTDELFSTNSIEELSLKAGYRSDFENLGYNLKNNILFFNLKKYGEKEKAFAVNCTSQKVLTIKERGYFNNVWWNEDVFGICNGFGCKEYISCKDFKKVKVEIPKEVQGYAYYSPPVWKKDSLYLKYDTKPEYNNGLANNPTSELALKRNNEIIINFRLYYGVNYAYIDKQQKIINYWPSPSKVSYFKKADDIILSANAYYNVIKEIRRTTDVDTKRTLRMDSILALNNLYTCYSLGGSSSQYDKTPAVLDENNVICIEPNRGDITVDLTRDITGYLSYALKRQYKVSGIDLKAYEKRTSEEMVRNLKTISNDKQMLVVKTDIQLGKAINAYFGADKNTVYAFWENAFFKMDNNLKKITAFQPTIHGITEIKQMSADSFFVVSDFLYQIINMATGTIISETTVPFGPYFALGMPKFQTSRDGKVGKLSINKFKCTAYFDTKTLQLLEYYHGEINDRYLDYEYKYDSKYQISKSYSYWGMLKPNGDLGDFQNGDSAITYVSKNYRLIDNPVSGELVKAFGFLNTTTNEYNYELYEGSLSNRNPAKLIGLWSVNIKTGFFADKPPVYETKRVAVRNRFPKEINTISNETEGTPEQEKWKQKERDRVAKKDLENKKFWDAKNEVFDPEKELQKRQRTSCFSCNGGSRSASSKCKYCTYGIVSNTTKESNTKYISGGTGSVGALLTTEKSTTRDSRCTKCKGTGYYHCDLH